MAAPYPLLSSESVHLWLGRTEDGAACAKALSAQELHHAAGLYFPLHRTRYVAARAALRRILGGYLDMPPGDVPLQQGPHGKPFVAAAANARAIRFNLSHSGAHMAVAVGCEHENGVDIEHIASDVNFLAIARRGFSAREYHALISHVTGERRAAFVRGWCRKEAYSKALQQGLARPLGSYEVSLGGDAQPLLLGDSADARATAEWTIRPIDALRKLGIEGALAVRRQVLQVETFELV
ncbi:4'-phosphopantetheinyl transferase family protein [Massilia sp. TSP1-1-2]|uniref:4'-phosphopantetheinyl transferase family protein n=1 Tax=Massilia sp. TSP1-1-2 TaxID=2804649 RepID=UPI003CEF45E6